MQSKDMRVAVIGSGPSGFFATEALQKAGVSAVDMFDRLPTPFGLVRGGVAPDHPKIKTVTKGYEKIAAAPGFRFFGNVEVGKHVTVDELLRHYDAVLFATGAQSDRRMDIPGEDLEGSFPATDFVGWYNGHPDYEKLRFGVERAKTAVVIGQGNVAMDVARILAKTVDELKGTDIAARALQALQASGVERVVIVGRRGAAQAKFTAPEVRELGELAAATCVIQPKDLELSKVDEEELASPDGSASKKNIDTMREILAHAAAHAQPKPRRVELMFCASPVRIEGKDGKVRAIVLEKTRLEGKAGAQKAVGTGETFELPCELVFRSVGYKGKAVVGVPFDDKSGTIPHKAGRVQKDGAAWPGVYVAGWIKRGPSGVIGTNKACAVESVESLLADAASLSAAAVRDPQAIVQLLQQRGARAVSFAEWQKIDAAEQARGKELGKPREKLATWDELLRAV